MSLLPHPDAPAHHHPLSTVDAAWLHMDTPASPMVITVLFELARPLPREALTAIIEERLLGDERRGARFRRRVVSAPLDPRPRWEDDPLFDVRSHVHHVALPAPGDRAALADLASDLMSTPLDPHRPLWQVHLVDRGEAGAAVIARIHHAVGDGVSLVRLLLGLADRPPARAPRAVGQQAAPPRGPGERLRRLVDQTRTVVRLLLLPADPKTPLSGPLGARKRAAWSAPIPFARVEAIAHAAGATVNDVLLAAMTGALRRDLDRRGGYRDGLEIRAMLPVNLRADTTAATRELGNRFGLIYAPLPLGEVDPVARLREVKRRLDALKAAPDAQVSFGVLGAMGLLTESAEHLGVDLFSAKASVLATNVPGPTEAIEIGGRRVERIAVWAPVSGRVALSFSFLSYAGAVSVGVNADEQRLPDADVVAADVEREIEALAARLTS